MSSSQPAPVLFESINGIGFATLNREAALNTLTTEMMIALKRQFEAWESDRAIRGIVLRGAGTKAFCAGGDVKTPVLKAREGDLSYGDSFFTHEYAHDELQYRLKKPLVVVAHGYVMGGGVGLLSGARWRIATSSTQLSMPEISIGLFPDVGGSYFLNRCPGVSGLFLALTAARLNATDAITLDLADHFIPDAALNEFYSLLSSSSEDLPTLCERFAMRFHNERPAAALTRHLSVIDSALSGPWRENKPLEAFENLKALQTDARVASDGAFQKAITTFLRGSPTSAFLIWEQLRRGRGRSLSECFAMELQMAKQCCRQHDFLEGVRAVLIDKDQNPNWFPATWSEVGLNLIEMHFQQNSKPLEY